MHTEGCCLRGGDGPQLHDGTGSESTDSDYRRWGMEARLA